MRMSSMNKDTGAMMSQTKKLEKLTMAGIYYETF
jgi:hypothetical protein